MSHRGGYPKMHGSKRTVRRWLARYNNKDPKTPTEVNRSLKVFNFLQVNPTWKTVFK